MLFIAASYNFTKSLWDIMITVQTPFDLFILPAWFFYYRYKEKQNTEDGDLSHLIRNQIIEKEKNRLLNKGSPTLSMRSISGRMRSPSNQSNLSQRQ